MAITAKGHIEHLPSGSFRVHVYAGTDPVTGKARRLKETCPDEASAAAALGKLLAQAQSQQAPVRDATHMTRSGALCCGQGRAPQARQELWPRQVVSRKL